MSLKRLKEVFYLSCHYEEWCRIIATNGKWLKAITEKLQVILEILVDFDRGALDVSGTL